MGIVDREELSQAEKLIQCFKREVADLPAIPLIILHELQPLPFNVSDLFYLRTERRMTALHDFAKLYLHEYLPTEPRALYLEPDTIIKADVEPLYQVSMQHAIAAVPEKRTLGDRFL